VVGKERFDILLGGVLVFVEFYFKSVQQVTYGGNVPAAIMLCV
jgi:hypothetical protein